MLLQAKSLTFTCGSRNLLDRINFTLSAHDKVGLVGPIGSGKTTLLRLLARELEPDDGEILISPDVDTSYLGQFVPSESKVTVHEKMFEKAAELERRLATLSRTLTRHPDDDGARAKYETLKEELSSRFGSSYRKRLEETLDLLGINRNKLRSPISELPLNEQAVLELARVLVRQPDLLILDEPTSYLDIIQRESLTHLLAAFPGSILVVDQDRAMLDRVVNRILELRDGRLRSYESDYPDYERQRRQQVHKQQNGTSKASRVLSKQAYVTAEDKPAQSADRRRVMYRAKAGKARHEPAIRVSNLTKLFGRRRILENVGFKVLSGDKVALVGPCGCGKTLLLKTLIGELSPDKGEIRIATGLKVGYLPQKRTLTRPTNPADEHTGSEFTAEMATALLSQIQQLSRECDILILDDPSHQLDIDSIIALEELLLEFSGTLLFTTHDRALLRRLANRLLVLSNNGRVDERPSAASFSTTSQ